MSSETGAPTGAMSSETGAPTGAMSSETGAPTIELAILSAERRIRTALRALLEADTGYRVSVATTEAEARTLLAAGRPAAAVVGLGSGSPSTDAALLRIAEEQHPRQTVVVGSRDGLDLDAGPDAILAAVARAVAGSTTAGRT